MPDIPLTAAGYTDTGRVRSNNQDAFYLDPEMRFFILADGMGGYTGGEVASAVTIKTVRQYLERALQDSYNSARPPQDWLNQATLLANEEILKDAQANPKRGDMGTTIVIALPLKSNLWYAHVGDSRLYRWRELQLQQLTGDHTLIADMVSHGLLEVEEARRHPYRNVLSRCLGRIDLKHATVAQASVKSGDRYLLCSDGLTEEVEDTQIAELLNRYPNDEEASKELVALANAQGGHDNTTVIVITIS